MRERGKRVPCPAHRRFRSNLKVAANCSTDCDFHARFLGKTSRTSTFHPLVFMNASTYKTDQIIANCSVSGELELYSDASEGKARYFVSRSRLRCFFSADGESGAHKSGVQECARQRQRQEQLLVLLLFTGLRNDVGNGSSGSNMPAPPYPGGS